MPEPSRADIAASLGARDPSWFRQTADRGIGSAAYRKDNEEAASADSHSSRGMRLRGMAGERPRPEEQQDMARLRSAGSPAPVDTKLESQPSNEPSGRPQSFETSGGRPLSGAPASSLDPRPLQDDSGSLHRTSTILSSAGRPPSPTKGLGGFVQSAMMKRSDSVSKRWSVQASTGLKRGDSVAGNRPAFNPPSATPPLGQARTISRDPRTTRDGTSSPLSSSRPTSSHEQQKLISTASKEAKDGETAPKLRDVPESADVLAQERPTTPPLRVIT